MIKILILITFIIGSSNSFCQTVAGNKSYKELTDSLQGVWSGKFIDKYNSELSRITITIRKIKKGYRIYSYSPYMGDTVVCEMSFKRISRDSIRLEEFTIMKPVLYRNLCFQTMNLHIAQNEYKLEMIGKWESFNNNSFGCGNGIIYLKKD